MSVTVDTLVIGEVRREIKVGSWFKDPFPVLKTGTSFSIVTRSIRSFKLLVAGELNNSKVDVFLIFKFWNEFSLNAFECAAECTAFSDAALDVVAIVGIRAIDNNDDVGSSYWG